ncbi:MAG: GWxTD domain-containing protein, partial [bacterium]|nr:GWxTD domain-containing protein [bacterium]
MQRVAVLVFAMCLFGTLPAIAEKADPAKVDSLLVAVSDTTLEFGQRVELAKEAVKYDETGKAMYALAQVYIEKGTDGALHDASPWLKRAMDREKQNADYRIAYAQLLWGWAKRKSAYKQAQQAIDADPNHVSALYLAARYAAWQMSRYLEGERVDYTYDNLGNQTQRTFSLEIYGEQDRDEAIGYLTRALSIDPDHRPSLVLLGLVYYEARMPEKLVSLCLDYLKRNPDESDAYFFLGLGYQAQDDLERAYPAYVKGLDKMPKEEQQFMMSVFMLVGKEALADTTAMPDTDALRAFWTGRDPLFLTPINERLMEHCGRVAYANLRFGDMERNVSGWATDKGQAYIRYGKPLARSVQPAEIDTGIDQPMWYQDHLAWLSKQGTLPYNYHARTEFWDYGGFRLTFTNTDKRDTWRFRVGWMGRQPVDYIGLVKRIPEFYQDPYKWERYDAPFQIAQFRGTDEKARVEVYYALPGEEVKHKEKQAGVQQVDVRQGLFLFDARWDTVQKVVGKVELMPWVNYESTREGYLFASENLHLNPGQYFLAAEVEDQNTKSVGTFRKRIQVQRFGYDSLQVSDLLLARKVVERDNVPMGRERFLILPNPLKQCNRLGQAYFYFEIYNMKKDDFGATNYEVTYQVRTRPEGEDVTQEEWTTAVSYTHKGSRDWEPLYQVLNLDTVPGNRDFRVVVKDLNGGQVAMASTE